MKKLYLHSAAFTILLFAAILISCEGPGVIEKNVYLEDTLIKTVYDTVYSEKQIEIFIYDTAWVNQYPESIDLAYDKGPFTGEFAYDTIKVIYPDTVINQLHQREISFGTDIIEIEKVTIIPGSERFFPADTTLIITVDLLVEYTDGNTKTIPGQQFVMSLPSDSQTLSGDYSVAYIKASVLWKETDLEIRSQYGSKDFVRSLEMPSNRLPNVNSTITLQKSKALGFQIGDVNSYAIRGNLRIPLSTWFDQDYVELYILQQPDSTFKYQTPLFLDSLILDTDVRPENDFIKQEELSQLSNSLIYYIQDAETISSNTKPYSTFNNYVYLSVSNDSPDDLPDEFEIVIITEINAQLVSGFGSTNESLAMTYRIGMAK